MEAFGIIDTLYNYCLTNDIYFIAGERDYQNALADQRVYDANDLIMLAFFNASPKIIGGKIISNSYSGEIGLGRKREALTVSSLDETFQQKYDNRLRELSTSLTNIIADLACENEFDITSLNLKLEMNQFDLNADFVVATINFDV